MTLYNPDRNATSIRHVIDFYDVLERSHPPVLASYRAPFTLPVPSVGEWVHAVDAPGACGSIRWKVVSVEHDTGILDDGTLIWGTSVRVSVMEWIPGAP